MGRSLIAAPCSVGNWAGSFRQAVLCPDLDYGTGCSAFLAAYLFTESYLAALVLILCATQCLSNVCVGRWGGGAFFLYFNLPELIFAVYSESLD